MAKCAYLHWQTDQYSLFHSYANIVLATLNDRNRFTKAGASVVTSNLSSTSTFRAAQAQIRSDINHVELPVFRDSQGNADGKVK